MKARYHSPFASAIERYLAVKRALNRRFDNEERSLRLFDRYLVEQDITQVAHVTAAVVEAFMVSRPRTRPRSYNHLLGVLRRYFGWMVQQGDMAVAPSLPRPRRTTSQYVPFLFDQTLAKRLLDVTAKLPDQPKGPARGMTYRMIFVLLYGLGLRVGEVCRLRCDDVDLRRNLLVVRESKFGKSRWVPFGPRIAAELIGYLQQAQHRSWRPDSPLFSFNPDRAVNTMTVSQTFHHLLPSLHLEIPPGVASPRLHHLRHSFAVGTLLRWYRSGIAPGQRLLRLSTFMGHIDPASTAVYLTITSELLNAANERFEQYALHGGDQR